MTKAESIQLFNDEFTKRIRETMCPDEIIPDSFNEYKHAVLQHTSYTGLGMPWQMFKVFCMKIEGFSLMEVAAICSLFTALTPQQLQPGITENYYDALEKVVALQKKVEELFVPIREGVSKKIEIMNNPAGMNGKSIKMVR